jgi:hypothetical protein
MLRKMDKEGRFENFLLPFDGKLKKDNRWVKLADAIPWEALEEIYGKKFSLKMGRPGLNVRIAVGALIIKHKQNLTDEETVEQIMENPYLQYFLGYEEFQEKAPFDASTLVYFRARFELEDVNTINELLVKTMSKSGKPASKDDADGKGGGNSGKLLIDATAVPADIKYPTDLDLLNTAREKSERLTDELHEECKTSEKKPRTYRRTARRYYLRVAKKRKVKKNILRAAIRKQLSYLGRNLNNIDKMLAKTDCGLDKKSKELLAVLRTVYKQQEEMFRERKHSVANRIVSISQPHIRPIVRGKASAPVEFGAKISVSVSDGIAYLDRLSWDAFNESSDLALQVEKFKERFGHYPASVHADKIYGTRENRKFLAEKNIKFSGAPLGRPKSDVSLEEKLERRQSEIDRIPIEGKFGNAKRRFSLDRILAKLKNTAETWIGFIFIVMNLVTLEARSFLRLFQMLFQQQFYGFCFYGNIGLVLKIIPR